MALATQCPHCYTSFRVANDQLKLHAGLVRCGSCKQTFNGIEHLLAPGEAPRTAPQQQSTPIAATPTHALETQATHATTTESDSADNQVAAEQGTVNSTTESIPSSPTTAAFRADVADEATAQSNDDDVTEADTTSALSSASHSPEPETASLSTHSDELAFDIDSMDGFDSDFEQASNHELDVDLPDPIETREHNLGEQRIEPVFEEEITPHSDLADDASAHEQDEEFDPMSLEEGERRLQQNLMQQFSAQLETIEPELGVADTETKQTNHSGPKKTAAITNHLEFELTKEEQELVEQADLLHQLELENRAAILDDDAQEWSKHEPSFDEKSLLAAFAADEALRAQELAPNNTPPVKPGQQEARESTTESNDLGEDQFDDDTHHKPGFVLQAEKKRRYGKWQTIGLSLACVVFVLGITAQTVYFLRSTIAAEFPAIKPQLVRACQALSCQINLPAERQMLEIAGSELLILNEELKINTLAFQLQNKSTTVQEWPVVELTLEDVRGKTVLQKVFPPIDYVKNKADIPKGIPARSESDHKLYFELNANKASNYKVSIFYP